MQLVIRGVVTTTSHTHQTMPDSKGLHLSTRVMTASGLLSGVPYISGNSVRGMIRRHAAKALFSTLQANGAQISRNLYLSIVRGTFARTGLEAGGAKYLQMIEASHHVFAGLFGGGAFMYRSSMTLNSELLPIMAINRHLFPSSVQHHAIDAKPKDLLTMTPMAPRDDFAKLTAEARAVVKDVGEAYVEHMATKVTQSAAKSSGESDKSDNLDNFTSTECMIPGVPLYFSITADCVEPSQAGLLLRAIASWANDNKLGGGSARGRGSFVPSLSLTIDGKLVAENLLTGDAPYLKLATCGEVTSLLAACDVALEKDATAESLSNVYPSEISEKAAKKKAKAEERAEAKRQAKGAAGEPAASVEASPEA